VQRFGQNPQFLGFFGQTAQNREVRVFKTFKLFKTFEGFKTFKLFKTFVPRILRLLSFLRLFMYPYFKTFKLFKTFEGFKTFKLFKTFGLASRKIDGVWAIWYGGRYHGTPCGCITVLHLRPRYLRLYHGTRPEAVSRYSPCGRITVLRPDHGT